MEQATSAGSGVAAGLAPRVGSDPKRVPLDVVLPDLRAHVESETAASRAGATCRPGCAACCRHLVPVTPAEARRLRRVAADLPDFGGRLARTRATLEEAGVWDALCDYAADPPSIDAAGRRWLADAYFAAWADCPFLDGEHCTIHDERPLACRLQSVSSPPAACRTGLGVIPLHPPGPPRVRALADLEGGDWLPLATILDVGESQAPHVERTPGEWATLLGDAARSPRAIPRP